MGRKCWSCLKKDSETVYSLIYDLRVHFDKTSFTEKAGMDLSMQEVDSLIQELLILQNPYTCPHGRPTSVKFCKNGEIKFL